MSDHRSVTLIPSFSLSPQIWVAVTKTKTSNWGWVMRSDEATAESESHRRALLQHWHACKVCVCVCVWSSWSCAGLASEGGHFISVSSFWFLLLCSAFRRAARRRLSASLDRLYFTAPSADTSQHRVHIKQTDPDGSGWLEVEVGLPDHDRHDWKTEFHCMFEHNIIKQAVSNDTSMFTYCWSANSAAPEGAPVIICCQTLMQTDSMRPSMRLSRGSISPLMSACVSELRADHVWTSVGKTTWTDLLTVHVKMQHLNIKQGLSECYSHIWRTFLWSTARSGKSSVQHGAIWTSDSFNINTSWINS